MNEIASRWREFEKVLAAKGLAWALEYAPVDLREARTPDRPHAARLDQLLPADDGVPPGGVAAISVWSLVTRRPSRNSLSSDAR